MTIVDGCVASWHRVSPSFCHRAPAGCSDSNRAWSVGEQRDPRAIRPLADRPACSALLPWQGRDSAGGVGMQTVRDRMTSPAITTTTTTETRQALQTMYVHKIR